MQKTVDELQGRYRQEAGAGPRGRLQQEAEAGAGPGGRLQEEAEAQALRHVTETTSAHADVGTMHVRKIYTQIDAPNFSEIGSDLFNRTPSLYSQPPKRGIGDILVYRLVISKDCASLQLQKLQVRCCFRLSWDDVGVHLRMLHIHSTIIFPLELDPRCS